MSHFRKAINNHHDGVLVSLGAWKTSDEVQTHVLSRGFGGRKRRIETLRRSVAHS